MTKCDAKILYVDHTAKLGGAELSLLDLASHCPGAGVALFEDGPLIERLTERRVDTHVLGGGQLDRVKRDGGWYAGILGAKGLISAARELSRLARQQGCDVLYANSLKAMLVAAVAGRLARVPVVWHLRDMLTPDHFSASNRRVCVAVSNRLVTRVIANSQATAQAYVDAGGRAPTSVLYNGIDAERYQQSEPAAEPPTNGRFVIGLFARLSPWKGQHVLIEALKELPGVEAWIIGEALFGEEDYAASLRRTATETGVLDRVRFLGFRDDIPGLMKRCDLVVHASTSPEPFGRVIVEAMFAGVPVVATDAGGARELIRHQDTGVLVPPAAPQALADVIVDLMGDALNRGRIAAAGSKWALENVSLDQILPKWRMEVAAVVEKWRSNGVRS